MIPTHGDAVMAGQQVMSLSGRLGSGHMAADSTRWQMVRDVIMRYDDGDAPQRNLARRGGVGPSATEGFWCIFSFFLWADGCNVCVCGPNQGRFYNLKDLGKKKKGPIK
jgi:hypothetical protein